jgi:hypothetical protein
VTAPPQGAACRRGRGTEKRIDSKLRRLRCLRPVRAPGHGKMTVMTNVGDAREYIVVGALAYDAAVCPNVALSF